MQGEDSLRRLRHCERKLRSLDPARDDGEKKVSKDRGRAELCPRGRGTLP